MYYYLLVVTVARMRLDRQTRTRHDHIWYSSYLPNHMCYCFPIPMALLNSLCTDANMNSIYLEKKETKTRPGDI